MAGITVAVHSRMWLFVSWIYRRRNTSTRGIVILLSIAETTYTIVNQLTTAEIWIQSMFYCRLKILIFTLAENSRKNNTKYKSDRLLFRLYDNVMTSTLRHHRETNILWPVASINLATTDTHASEILNSAQLSCGDLARASASITMHNTQTKKRTHSQKCYISCVTRTQERSLYFDIDIDAASTPEIQ